MIVHLSSQQSGDNQVLLSVVDERICSSGAVYPAKCFRDRGTDIDPMMLMIVRRIQPIVICQRFFFHTRVSPILHSAAYSL